nr:hypothetical protein Iba_chr12aCG14230 [Ipomoea batatas]GMD66565.1 hypothetical protein Iba_chr12cCG16230 [Ipomoea batatas]
MGGDGVYVRNDGDDGACIGDDGVLCLGLNRQSFGLWVNAKEGLGLWVVEALDYGLTPRRATGETLFALDYG